MLIVFLSLVVSKSALVFLSDGYEPIEGIIPIEYLRLSGVEVTTTSITNTRNVVSGNLFTVIADKVLDDVKNNSYDALIVIGGMPGTERMKNCSIALEMIKKHFVDGKLIAAVCAAPAHILGEKCNIIEGKKVTGYPGTEDLIKKFGGIPSEGKVIVDGNLITSKGPGTCIEWSLEIIKYLLGEEKKNSITASTVSNNTKSYFSINNISFVKENPSICILAANGFEPSEIVVPLDFMGLAGFNITMAVVSDDLTIKDNQGIEYRLDTKFEDIKANVYDAILVPGGMPGTSTLASNVDVIEFIKKHKLSHPFVQL